MLETARASCELPFQVLQDLHESAAVYMLCRSIVGDAMTCLLNRQQAWFLTHSRLCGRYSPPCQRGAVPEREALLPTRAVASSTRVANKPKTRIGAARCTMLAPASRRSSRQCHASGRQRTRGPARGRDMRDFAREGRISCKREKQ